MARASSCLSTATTCRTIEPLGISGPLAAPLLFRTGAGDDVAWGWTLPLALTFLEAGGATGTLGTGSRRGSLLAGLFVPENSQSELEVDGSDSLGAAGSWTVFLRTASALGMITAGSNLFIPL